MPTAPSTSGLTPTIRGLPRPLARALEAYADPLDVEQILEAYDPATEVHNKEDFDVSFRLGEDFLDKEGKKKVRRTSPRDHHAPSKAAQALGQPDWDHVLTVRGRADLGPTAVFKHLFPDHDPVEVAQRPPTALEKLAEWFKISGCGVRIQGVDDLTMRHSRCRQSVPSTARTVSTSWPCHGTPSARWGSSRPPRRGTASSCASTCGGQIGGGSCPRWPSPSPTPAPITSTPTHTQRRRGHEHGVHCGGPGPGRPEGGPPGHQPGEGRVGGGAPRAFDDGGLRWV